MVQWVFVGGFIAVGWIAGIILYHPGSVGLGLSIGRRGDRIARYHFKESARVLRRFLLYIREQADVHMLPSSPNTDEGGGEKVTFSGKTQTYEDPAGTMGYLYNTPMSLVTADSQVMTHPIIAEAGEVKSKLQDKGRWWKSYVEFTDELQGRVDRLEGVPGLLPIPRIPRGIDVKQGLSLVGHGAEPDAVSTTYDYMEKAEMAFNSPNGQQLFVIAALYGMGVGGTFVLSMLTSGGGGGAPAPSTPPGNTTNAMVWLLLVGLRRWR